MNPAPQLPGGGDPEAANFAQVWAAEVSRITYVPMQWPDKVTFLRKQAERLVTALRSEPFRDAMGYQVGAALVAADFAAPEALACTVALLHTRLAEHLHLPATCADRVAHLAQAVSIGHCRAVRDRTLDGQDAVCRAAVQARYTAEKQLQAEQARARHAALHDTVTDLPNRTLFTDRLTQILHQSGRHARFAVSIIDLDNFPAITDSLGPRLGDRLLAAAGARLAGFAAEHRCLLARLDGVEFALLFDDTTGAEDAIKRTDRALALLSGPFIVEDQDLTVRASAGIVEAPVVDADPGETLRAARSALHWAQHDGGGRWTLFDAERNAAQLHRYRISAAIPPALARGQFTLHYQPIIQLGTGRVAGVDLDASFTHALTQAPYDGRATAIIANLIDLGHTLGLTVTAEGATTDQAALLHSMRCDLGQGYELGLPTSSAQLMATLSQRPL